MMIAVLDESSPTRPDGVIIYALGVVVLDDAEYARLVSPLTGVLNRKRPFHWEADKGPEVRGRVVAEMCGASLSLLMAATEVSVPKRQNGARERLLRSDVLPMLARMGVDRLEIESRSNDENSSDTRSIRNWYRDQQSVRCPELKFVDKRAPVAWLADAASGLWADALLGRETPLARLVAAGRVSQATCM